MAEFLVTKLVDVTGAALAKVEGTASLGSPRAAGQKMSPTKTPGVLEIALPAGASFARVVLTRAGFWPVSQDIEIDTSTRPPTAKFDGDQHLNVRGVAVHTRGSDFNVEIDVVMGHLRDVTANVAQINAGRHDHSIAPRSINRFATPILKPGGSPPDLFNVSQKTVDPHGPLLFAERTSVPKLLAVLNPGWPVIKGARAAHSPLHYHVFFPPAIPGTWSDDYPFGDDYLDFVARYVNRVFPPDAQGKGMAYQNNADFAKTIFVFPVGDKKQQLRNIAGQGSLLRLLLEINYWIQRVRGVPHPRQPLGGAGISAFSRGADDIVRIMNGPRNARFWDKVLRMICMLDGVQSAAEPLRTNAVAWHRNGQGNRHLRLYSQWPEWIAYESDYPAATQTKGFAGSREREGDGVTLLFAPVAFWQGIWPKIRWGAVHQVFPAWFMEHAVSKSGFAPP